MNLKCMNCNRPVTIETMKSLYPKKQGATVAEYEVCYPLPIHIDVPIPEIVRSYYTAKWDYWCRSITRSISMIGYLFCNEKFLCAECIHGISQYIPELVTIKEAEAQFRAEKNKEIWGVETDEEVKEKIKLIQDEEREKRRQPEEDRNQ